MKRLDGKAKAIGAILAMGMALPLSISCIARKPVTKASAMGRDHRPKASPSEVARFALPGRTEIVKAEIVAGDTLTVGKGSIASLDTTRPRGLTISTTGFLKPRSRPRPSSRATMAGLQLTPTLWEGRTEDAKDWPSLSAFPRSSTESLLAPPL